MYNVQRLVPRLQGVSVGRSLLARPRPLMATQTTSSSLLTAPSREFGTFEEYKKPISYRNGRYEDDVINNGASRRGGSATSSTATPTTQTHSGDKLRVPSEYAQENSTQNSGGILDQASQLAANLTSKAKEVMKDGFNKVGDAMSSARSAMSDNMGLKSDDTNISSSSSSMNSLHNSVKPKSQDTYSAFSSSQKDDRPFPSGVKTTSPERDSEFPSKHKVQSKNQNAKKKTDQGRPVEGLRNMGSSIPINPSDFHTGTGATGGGISSTSSGTSSGMGGSTGMGSLKGTGMGEGSNKSQFTELSSNNPFNISIENQKDMATDAMSSKKPTPLDKQADLSLDKMAGADYANFNHLTGAGGTSSKPAFKPASSSIGLKPSDAITSPPITEIRRPFSMGTQKPTGAEHKKSMAGADYGSMQGPDKSGQRAEGMSQASHKRSNKSEDEEMDMSKRVDRSATASAKHMENTGTAGSAIGMGSVSHAPSQGKGPEESAPSVSQGVFSSGPRLDDKDKQDRQEVSWEKKDMKDSNVKQDNEESGRFNKATHMDASKRDSTTGGPKIGATFSPMGEDGLGPRGTRKKSTKASSASTTDPSLGLNETNKDKQSNAAMSNMEDTEEHKKSSKRHCKTSTGTGKSKTVGNVSDTNEKQSPTDRFLDSVASTRRGNEMKNDGGAPQEQNWEKLNTSGDHSKLGHKGGPKSMAREPKQEEMKDNLQNPQRRSMGSVGSVEEMESPNLDAEIHAPSGRSAPASRTADTRAVDGQYGKSRPVSDNSLPTSDEQWKPM